ncbi:alpha-D-glucose phosphate-specific phosphoglucomutase, partial [Desulfobacterota bacterium AH_259_B03_O07]|nr:alpha-D-glucose phosphate-specific phosphoglucomutase [Desulfobacterota bacterium AH_259_B03_O07]
VIPGFRDGVTGVARSMPTSTAVDRVAADLGIPCYETPTGWKFFGDLMDANLCSICGEESFGTGSNHVREKDGMWVVLCWLAILASTKKSVKEILGERWRRFGRSFYQRHDYEGIETDRANEVIQELRNKLPSLVGASFAESNIKHADEFNYKDPVSGIMSEHQGLRIFLSDGSRVVCRLSGTGTKGVTIRLYHECYRTEKFNEDINSVLKPLVDSTFKLLQIREICGRDKPTLIT